MEPGLTRSSVWALLLLLVLSACSSSRTRESETPVVDGPRDPRVVSPIYRIGEGKTHDFEIPVVGGSYFLFEVDPIDQNVFVRLGDQEIKTRRWLPERVMLAPETDTVFRVTIEPAVDGGTYTLMALEEGPARAAQNTYVALQEAYWSIPDTGNNTDLLRDLIERTPVAVYPHLRLRLLERLVVAMSLRRDPETATFALDAARIARSVDSPAFEASVCFRGLYGARVADQIMDFTFRLTSIDAGDGPASVGIERYTCGGLITAGSLFSTQHEHQIALELYRRALEMARASGDVRFEAISLQNIGLAYAGLGNNQRFRDYLDLAEEAWYRHRSEGAWRDIMGIAAYTLHRGRYHQERGEYEDALAFYCEVADSLSEQGNSQQHISTYEKIGTVLTRLGRYAEAIEYFEMSLATSQAILEAKALIELASVYRLMAAESSGETAAAHREKALTYLEEAWPLVFDRDRVLEANLALLEAELRREAGRADPESFYRHALNLVETQREQVKEERVRGDLFATTQNYFSAYIDFLIARAEEGDVARALVVAERARARTLLDAFDQGPPLARFQFDWDLTQRYWHLRHRLELVPEAEQAALEAELAALRAELARREQPELDREEIVGETAIRAMVDDDSLILSYHLDAQRGRVWAVTAQEISVFPTAGRTALEPMIRELRESLAPRTDTAAASRRRALLARISETLLGPVADYLDRRRLILVSDGPLQLLPFSMLPDPERGTPLVVDHTIVNLPSVSVLAAMRKQNETRAEPTGNLAVFADPKYQASGAATAGDASSVRDKPSLPLPATRREALAIASLFGRGDNLIAMGTEAVKTVIPRLADYRFLHFATHGEIDTENPGRSSLVLSLFDTAGRPRDGYLTLDEISALDLNADLVVLSACQTGLGREVRGEGLMSLARGFMHAGAPSIVATLWQVSDSSTSAFMLSFYRYLIRDRLDPDEALRRARNDLRADERWSDPYYWAPFILIGDWHLGANQP